MHAVLWFWTLSNFCIVNFQRTRTCTHPTEEHGILLLCTVLYSYLYPNESLSVLSHLHICIFGCKWWHSFWATRLYFPGSVHGKSLGSWLWWSRGSVLPLSTQVLGFKPGWSCQDFSGRKNPQHAFLRKGSKVVRSHVVDLWHLKDPWIDVQVAISGKISG
jgi:hypothetical protein